jgi:predicted phage gp36 major capsid-like protein
MNVELVPHLFATANNRPSGQRGFYAWWRVGADSVNDAAFRLMNVNTTA